GATGPVGIFVSNDGGVTWTQLVNGLPNQVATDVALDPVNPLNVYAAIGYIFGSTDNGIYKSVDGGASWTKLAGGLATNNVGRISLGIAASNPQRLYALFTNKATSTGDGATTLHGYRTDNGGTNWTQINPGDFQATYGWYLSFVSVSPTNQDTVIMGGF